MNRVILSGRLVKEPEVRVTTTEKTVCTFTLAVARRFTNGETDFINIVAWGKTAEYCGNHLNKGQLINLEGRLQIRSYEDKNKTKHWISEVIADGVENMDHKKEKSEPSPMDNFRKAPIGKPIEPDDEIPF